MKGDPHLVWLIVLMAIAAGLAQANEPKQGDEIENSLGMRLVYIPPGTFQMGSAESEPGRERQEVQHEVRLTKGFYLGVHEVTVGQCISRPVCSSIFNPCDVLHDAPTRTQYFLFARR